MCVCRSSLIVSVDRQNVVDVSHRLWRLLLSLSLSVRTMR